MALTKAASNSFVLDPGHGGVVTAGNFHSYSSGVYQAYTGMWGLYLGAPNTPINATSSMRVQSTRFPAWTKFTWDVTPSSSWGGVNGFLQVSYGNYDDSAGQITPRQVNAITSLSMIIDWAVTGDTATGLLCECWLTPTATPTGGVAKTCEVGFFPKTSPSGASFLAGLSAVGAGSFVDSNGVTWNVRVSDTYYIAYPPGYADFKGVLPFKEYFAFLVAAGAISGSLWFNGLAIGPEPKSGAGSFTLKKFTPTYS